MKEQSENKTIRQNKLRLIIMVLLFTMWVLLWALFVFDPAGVTHIIFAALNGMLAGIGISTLSLSLAKKIMDKK